MLNQENLDKCIEVLNKYGYRLQTLMVIEECSELQQAACKLLRGEPTPASQENFKEEIVDVIVMTAQAVMMSGMSAEEINRRAQEKLDRTLAR